MFLKKILFSLLSLVFISTSVFSQDSYEPDETEAFNPGFRVLGAYSPGSDSKAPQLGAGVGSNSYTPMAFLLVSQNNNLYLMAPLEKGSSTELDGDFRYDLGLRVPFIISAHAQAGIVGDMELYIGANDERLSHAAGGLELGAGFDANLLWLVAPSVTWLRQYKLDVSNNGLETQNDKGVRYELMLLGGMADFGYERIQTNAAEILGSNHDERFYGDVELGRAVVRVEYYDEAALIDQETAVENKGVMFSIGATLGKKSDK